jgi:hypothetical protein
MVNGYLPSSNQTGINANHNLSSDMSFKKICTAMINGKRWSIGFGYTGKTKGIVDDGSCNYQKRQIVIHAAHNGRTRSLEECVIHEVAHAHFPQLDEFSIQHFGDVCAKVLLKMKTAEPDKH